MFTRLAENYMVLYWLVMLVLGFTLGVLATYLISFITAILQLNEFMYSMFSLGGG